MQKLGFVLLCAAMLASAPHALAAGAKADDDFKKKRFAEALTEYDEILKHSPDDYRSVFRAATCQAMLFRYGEAAQRLEGKALPRDPRWRVRFLLLRAELGREFLKQFGHRISATVEEGTNDVTRKTPAEWRKEIRESFAELWAMREKLLGYKLADESDYVDLVNSDVSLAPTLLDFVVLRWTDYLSQEEVADSGQVKPDASSMLSERFSESWSENLPLADRIAAILETASRMPAGGRELAIELWRLNRTELPFNHPELFRFPDAADAVKALHARAEGVFEGLFEKFSRPRARGLAGYRAAFLYNGDDEFERAVKLCQRVEKAAKDTSGGDRCHELRASIEMPRLDLSSYPVPPNGKKAFSVSARNVEDVYLRAYPTTLAELESLQRKTSRFGNRDFGYLRWIETETLKTFIAREPKSAWHLRTVPENPYHPVQAYADLPDPARGLYVIVASNEKEMKPGTSLIKGTIADVTGVMLVGTSGQAGRPSDQETTGTPKSNALRFEFYALDAESGAPLPGTTLDGLLWDYDQSRSLNAQTDADGHAGFLTELRGERRSHQFDVLATHAKDLAYLSSPLYAYYQRPSRYEIKVETDRPAYRPGQKVLLKVTGLERVPRGFHAPQLSKPIYLRVMDANYQEVFRSPLGLDSFGGASAEFVVPSGHLLGTYTASASFVDGNETFSGGTQFSVEEYKRPEFEVAIDPPKSPWRFGREIPVSGAATYYFGGPVPDAPVEYRVYRQVYIPWFCWWWKGLSFDSSRKEVASGRTKTDATGKFRFSFTPIPIEGEKQAELPETFTVEIDARDESGRTIGGSRDFRAGKHGLLFNIPLSAGFFREGQSIALKPSLVDLNEQPVSAEGSYEVRTIESAPKDDKPEWRFPGVHQERALEVAFSGVPDAKVVKRGALKLEGAKGAELALGGLSEGLYRARFKAKDPWGGDAEQAIVFVVVDTSHTRLNLPLPGVALVEHQKYAPGEKVKVLVGSSLLSGAEEVEAWGGRFLLARKTLSGGGPQLVEFGADDEWKGGAVVRWFGAGGFELRGGQAEVEVPWADKELKTELAYDTVLKPGQKVKWSLLAKDPSGRGVDAEATFRVFDRSLEYYTKGVEPWVKSLYEKRWIDAGESVSMAPGSITDITIEHGWIKEMLEAFHKGTKELLPPALLLNRTRMNPRRFGRARIEELESLIAKGEPKAASPMDLAKSSGAIARDAKEVAVLGGKREGAEHALRGPDVQARTNFSETAHFDPALGISRGRADIRFQVPEQLTSWKIDASVLTADAKWGYASGSAVTRKDLMVQVEMPRFYRENDRGQIKALIHNETDRKLSGRVQVVIQSGTEKDAVQLLGLQGPLEKPFEATAHGVVAISWPVAPPAGVRDFKIRAIARSGELVDAEERDLPILPSRQRLIESQIVVLDGDAKKRLTLPGAGKNDPTRQSELMEFRVDPQLALTVLNSLPFLVQYPFECTEQVLDRFVPTGIVNAFYEKYPAIAEATKKIPKRYTVTPPWEKDDPRRMTTLLETPWKLESEGGHRLLGLVDMLNPEVVLAQRDDALQKLKAYQLQSGGFPWFPGGRADPYMTLVVLGGFAEATRYGVPVPEEVRDRALRYVFSEIPQHLKPDEGNLALILYAAFVTTSFEKSLPMTGQALELAKAWLDYAIKHEEAMTPMGHAYAAHIYWRTGREHEGDEQLARALDGSREDPVAGVYWTPEKISWLWYNDTLEKHAFFLKTLVERKPDDPRLPGMVKWILFNRKGNEWKSTKAAASAIYSLLDVMKKRGSLDRGDLFHVAWKGVDETVNVGPTDWLAKPLAWDEKGAEAPSNPKASDLPQVEKTGPGYAFASLTWIYSTGDLPAEGVDSGLIAVARSYFRRVKEGEEYHLKPLESGASLAVGDELEVHLTIRTRSQFEYVYLKDPKPAGFEAETLLSGWQWDQLARYEEPRDSLTNFFMSWVPHGEYVLKYRLRATTAGQYRVGPAALQSMYAPEMSGYSSGFIVNVKD